MRRRCITSRNVTAPAGTPESEVGVGDRGALRRPLRPRLARQGISSASTSPPGGPGARKAVGFARADTKEELDGFLGAVRLNGWMHMTVMPREPHPNDMKQRWRSRGAKSARNHVSVEVVLADDLLVDVKADGNLVTVRHSFTRPQMDRSTGNGSSSVPRRSRVARRI